MLCSDPDILDRARSSLERKFGEPLLISAAVEWAYSAYYRDELGWPLLRQFIFFRNAIDPSSLPGIKVTTNKLEQSFSLNGKRRINLDPGYITLSKIVLASTKNYAHRVYLGKGIYGEITLYYQGGTFRPHLFTYRDYKEPSCIEMFVQARALCKKQIGATK